ncbi:MAG: hypothetical protein ACO3SP_09690 [Ilumatobacteraceae bacterium]
MKPDFDSSVVLANTARVLRSEILPAIHDEDARPVLIRIIAVIEGHLAQMAAEDPGGSDEATRRAALAALDGAMLMAFGGRLQDDQPTDRDGST